MTMTLSRRHHRRLETAEGFLLLDMPVQALREIDSVRASGLDTADVCRLRGEALRSSQRHAEALDAFEQADRVDPDDLTTLMGMAWCFKRLDRLHDAIEVMERAYRSHPDEPIVLYNIACYHSLAGEKPQTLSWLGRALRMEPNLRSLIVDETDFNSFRDDADFQFIIADPHESDEVV